MNVYPPGLPVLYTTEPGSGQQFAARAKASGFGSIGLHVKLATPADYAAVHNAGLLVHAWGIANDGGVPWPTGADVSGPQIEGPGQRDSALQLMPSLPASRRGIVTNFGGVPFSLPPDAFTAVECFAVEGNPAIYADLARMTNQATIYGLPNPFPVPETIRGVGLELYPQLASWGRNFGIWRAEQAPEQMWDQVKRQVSMAPIPIVLRVKSQTATAITFEWDKPAIQDIEAYLFCSAAMQKPSWTRDANRTTVTFGINQGPYWVMALTAGAYGQHP